MRPAYTHSETTDASAKSRKILRTPGDPIDFAMDADAAVARPRIHFEDDVVHIEHGFTAAQVAAFRASMPQAELWPEPHMFFGGAHTTFTGAGDPRRGGVTMAV